MFVRLQQIVEEFQVRTGPETFKPVGAPDKKQIVVVCLHVWAFSCAAHLLLCFFTVIRQIPLLFLSPTMHCCLYQAGRQRKNGALLPPPHTFITVLLLSFHSPEFFQSVALKAFHNLSRSPLSSGFNPWLVGGERECRRKKQIISSVFFPPVSFETLMNRCLVQLNSYKAFISLSYLFY